MSQRELWLSSVNSDSTIKVVSERLFSAKTFDSVSEKLGTESDISVAVPISARPLFIAATFVRRMRTILVLTSGEAAADQLTRELRLWLGAEQVLQLSLYSHQPWRDQPISDEHINQLGMRAEALHALKTGKACIVVAGVEAMLRHLIPVQIFNQPLKITTNGALPDGLSYETFRTALVNWGYDRFDHADAVGQFSIRGDVVDIWPAGALHPSRIEFFGDEVDKIRRLVPSTGQSIGLVDELTIFPAKPVILTETTINRGRRRIYGLKPDQLKSLPMSYAQHLEAIQAGSYFPEIELYLPYLYDKPATPLDYLHKKTMIIALEPRSLFDAAARYYDQQRDSVLRNVIQDDRAQAILSGLFTSPADLTFGQRQLMTVMTLISGNSGLDLRLEVKHPTIAGSEERLAAAARNYTKNDYLTIIGSSSNQARASVELALLDEHVSFAGLESDRGLLSTQIAWLTETEPISAMSIPAAKLALLGLNDNSASSVARRVRSSRHRSSAENDPTALTFPFKPGDYVVHETHGIALFKAIVRQEVAGIERDYLHLEYAQGDKLFTPVDQIGRVTRYIGPNSSAPRLTRLNTSDWSRATGKARRAARQLAFDLVDLYARRLSTQGFVHAADNEMQYQLELAFPYDETPDQLAAIADVKADMESPRPMDRLICGDVGFGKTEVALRAAFKAIQAGRQVMLLAPTTILAQQHYTTFYGRFDPFAVTVDVLSRFRTAAEQRRILEQFAAGRLDMLIGTHRLLSADVNPNNLGLIVIDEEQRFGVQHKEQLKNLREQVDVLTLSATPIPRTMQMALSGVRDMSLINTPPISRTPVKVQVGEWNEDTVSAAIRHEIGRGGQVYYVSNRVRTIEDAVARVFAAAPEATVGVAHGQMAPRQLEDVMERFAAGEFSVLIATTIIESGLDNPKTNTLIIEDSERLGLAQLYQLKGRVGRSHDQAYAYFLYPAENQLTVEAMERLMAIDEHQDLGSGIRIAMRDLEIRGAGTLLGAEQSGNIAAVGFDFFASMINDAVKAARAGELAEGQLDDNSSKQNLTPKQTVRLDLPEPCFFPEEYMAGADQRVAFYRRLAAADDLDTLDELEFTLVEQFGALPAAARNLLNKERCRILAAFLALTSIYLQRRNFCLEGIHLDAQRAAEVKKRGGLYFARSYRLQWPVSELQARMTTDNDDQKPSVDPDDESLYPHLVNLLNELANDLVVDDEEGFL